MAEASSTTKPKYLQIPIPPAPIPNGKDDAPPLGVQSIEERPAPAKDPSDAIVEVAGTLLRAATARIAYHEEHAKRLRAACASFAAMSRQPAEAGAGASDGELLAQLLRVAKSIEPGGDHA